MKTESRKCIKISKIVEYLGTEYLGTDVTRQLPKIHTVTGYDTTSSLHVVAKIKVLKKCLNGTKKSGF